MVIENLGEGNYYHHGSLSGAKLVIKVKLAIYS